jgi:integrase
MAFRSMIRTGLRVSEALSLRRSDLRLNQDPPVISARPEAPGNEARKGREVPIPADLLESLADLASFHSKDRSRPMLDISWQWVGKTMKRAAAEAGIYPA